MKNLVLVLYLFQLRIGLVEVKQADSEKHRLSDRKGGTCFLLHELDSTLLNTFPLELILPSIDVKQTDRVSCRLSNCRVLLVVFSSSLEKQDAARRAVTGFASKVISVAAAMASTLNMPLAMLACTVFTDG